MKQKQTNFGILLVILVAAFALRMLDIKNADSVLSAMLGILMILGIFLLASELFQNYTAGLISAYFTAFSYWATSFSQTGFEIFALSTITIFSFYFLFRGLRLRKLHDFIISGFIFGLGFYAYATFCFFLLMLATFIALLVIINKKFLINHWKHIFVFIIATFISAASTLFGFLPANTGNNISSPELLFYVRLLNPVIIILFLMGFFYIIIKFLHVSWHHIKKRDVGQKIHVYIFLLLWLFLPVYLKIKFDLTTVLPAIMIVSVIPILWIIKKYHSFGHAFRIFITSSLFAIFMFIGIYDVIRYLIFLQNS